ncbi:DUF1499 domain-containing protein [Marinomonas agarivorans]|nr:DUF1499 domain-containing protein [Marinomonas agarivorans]
MKRYITTILYLLFIIVGSIAFLSIAGIRVGLVDPLSGFLMIKLTVFAAAFLCFASISFYLLGYFVFNKGKCFNHSTFYIICITISFIYSASWLTFHYQKKQLPLLNDVVTDVNAPLMFIRIGDLRHTDDNSIEYSGKASKLQKNYYPDIKPLVLEAPSDAVFNRVVELVQSKGWDVVSLYPKEKVIEATVTTPVFWFIDDVIIQIKDEKGHSVVDMRSSSRIGQGDYGTNAQRVIDFLKELALIDQEPVSTLDNETIY